MAERGVVVSYETVRRWCEKFGSVSDRAVALQSKMRNHISRINELPLQGICEIAVKPAKIG
jgi:transposase-like protein